MAHNANYYYSDTSPYMGSSSSSYSSHRADTPPPLYVPPHLRHLRDKPTAESQGQRWTRSSVRGRHVRQEEMKGRRRKSSKRRWSRPWLCQCIQLTSGRFARGHIRERRSPTGRIL